MLNRLLLPLVFVPAVACGGGGSPTPMPVDTTPPTPDGPTVVACSVIDPIGGLTFGNAQTPIESCMMNGADVPCDFIAAPTMGPNTGMDEFTIAAFLPPEVDGDNNPTDALIVKYVLPFINNSPKNLDTTGGVATGMNSYTATAFILGDFDQAGSTVQNFYMANDGAITLTSSGVTANSIIAGSLSMSNFREIDPQTGADVADGCATGFALNFAVKQEAAPAKPSQPSQAAVNRTQSLLEFVKSDRFAQIQRRN